jgi:aspartyl-tRNA(Asn)/glutamyl-tRNA(Gln) amidotransferase subunit B
MDYSINMDKYDLIVALEIHVEPKTKSKMFCSCSADFWEKEPNTQTCPVCLGLPGALPVANAKAIELAIKTGLALHSTIRKETKFDRKHYFYPDLPKGYQLSQYDEPICEGGYIDIKNEKSESKRVTITRVHMEEDVAKSMHKVEANGDEYTLIDYNKSGVPLFELVTEPVMSSGEEAWEFAKKFQQILQYLGVSDAAIEKGQMRCEPNLSIQKKGTWEYKDGQIKPIGDAKLYPKIEIKNIASTSFIKKAVDYEFNRLVELAERGEEIRQQTRGWNANKSETEFQRYKETAQDYRYFPDPDLPPIEISDALIAEIQAEIPQLPHEKVEQYEKDFGITAYDASILVDDIKKAEYFEEVAKLIKEKDQIKEAVKLLNGPIAAWSNAKNKNVYNSELEPTELISVVSAIANGEINKNAAPKLLESLLEEKSDVSKLINKLGLTQVTDSTELEKWVDEALKENLEVVQSYLAGKESVMGFIVGQVMQKSKGSADPGKVNQIVKAKLDEIKKANG